MADDGDGAFDEEQRAIALARCLEELTAMMGSLPERFPDAYGGMFGGPTNDHWTIQVIENAPGAEELVETVRRAEQRSLDQVGVSFRFHFEPATITHAKLDAVRAELSTELIAQRELHQLGMTGVGLSKSRVSVNASVGAGPAVQIALHHRYPDIPFEVREVRVWYARSAGPPRPLPPALGDTAHHPRTATNPHTISKAVASGRRIVMVRSAAWRCCWRLSMACGRSSRPRRLM